MRSKTYKTQGIVIKRINFGEADKILTVFTKHYGKISCIAKGIRKLTSRKAASLELFTLAVIFLVKGKNLDIVTETKIIDSFSELRKDLKKITLAYQFCELTDRLTAECQSNKLIFHLLSVYLKKLTLTELDFYELEREFKIELLKYSGFGLPSSLQNKNLDTFIENIIERKINSKSLLKNLDI